MGFSKLQNPDGLGETKRQERPPPSYVSKGVTKVNNNQFAAMMWVEKNAFMAEYKASSAQYNTKSRTITETILTADKLSKAGKLEDAQKLYESAAQSMLDLKNEPEYAQDQSMKNQFARIYKRLSSCSKQLCATFSEVVLF